MMVMSDCLFCKIAARELPSTIRYEDDDVIAFDDIHPKAKIHVLIVPKIHVTSMNELPNEDPSSIGRWMLAVKRLASDLGVKEGGFKTIINTGKDGGQLVDHLHIHLLGGEPIAGKV